MRQEVLKFLGHPKAREIFGILFMALAILLLASLISFDASDPSFFHYRGRLIGPVKNLAGNLGAHLAGDLFELLGISSFLLPIYFFLLGWVIFWRKDLPYWGLKLAGLVLLLVCLSLLSGLLWAEIHLNGFRLDRAGGLLGEGLANLLLPSLGRFGLYLFTLTGLLVSLILLSQRSLPQLVPPRSTGRRRSGGGLPSYGRTARRGSRDLLGARRGPPRGPRRNSRQTVLDLGKRRGTLLPGSRRRGSRKGKKNRREGRRRRGRKRPPLRLMALGRLPYPYSPAPPRERRPPPRKSFPPIPPFWNKSSWISGWRGRLRTYTPVRSSPATNSNPPRESR